MDRNATIEQTIDGNETVLRIQIAATGLYVGRDGNPSATKDAAEWFYLTSEAAANRSSAKSTSWHTRCCSKRILIHPPKPPHSLQSGRSSPRCSTQAFKLS